SMKDFICFLFGHKYMITQRLPYASARLCCRRCRRMFAMNDDVRCVLPWDSEFHCMYESHGVKIVYLDWEGK
ncbi:MAG: hypothetical protein ABFE07_17945, partial [Armatimonadia bacterium]